MPAPHQDHYDVLDLDATPGQQQIQQQQIQQLQIQRACRKTARQYHPEINKDQDG